MADDGSAKRFLGKKIGGIALRSKSEAAAVLAVELPEAMLATSPGEFQSQVLALARQVAPGVSVFDGGERERAVFEICRALVRIYAGRVKSAAAARAGEWLVEALAFERAAMPAADEPATAPDPSVETGDEDALEAEPAPATPETGAREPT